MALLFNAGTLTATTGSKNITFSGSGLLPAHAKHGDEIRIEGGYSGFINTIDYAAQTATIEPKFMGTSGAGKAFSVRRATAISISTSEVLTQVYHLLDNFSAFDAKSTAFFYLFGQGAALARYVTPNNDDPTLVTQLVLSATDVKNMNIGPIIETWRPKTLVMIRSVESAAYSAFLLTSLPGLTNGLLTFGAQYVSHSGTMAANDPVVVGYVPGLDYEPLDNAVAATAADVAAVAGVVAAATDAKTAAEAAQTGAETARAETETAQIAAETAQGLAETARAETETAKIAAETAQGLAETAQIGAENAQELAETARDAAAGSAMAAGTSKTGADTARTGAEAARNKAQEWAEKAVDNPVSTGAYSAKHHATKAAASASAAAGSATTANTAKNNAETAQTAAEAARSAAQTARTGAETARTGAETARTGAQTAQGLAEGARDAAVVAKNAAETTKGLIDTAKTAVDTAKGLVDTAKTGADTARTGAEAARNKAQEWAEKATDSTVETGAYSAKHHATKAAASATAAATSNTNAGTAKTAAETARTAAQTARTGAETAQGLSETARDAAVTAKTAAETAKGLAETAKSGADTAKTGADTARNKAQEWAEKAVDSTVETGAYSAKHHATKAAASASAASGSATTASTANTNAQSAKTAAETARNDAQTARTDAQTARTDAIAAKTGAEAAKTAAETARNAAAASATAADGHADRAEAAAELAEATNPANYLVKAQNGADVPNKPAFVQNIGAIAQAISLTNGIDLNTVVTSGQYKMGSGHINGPGYDHSHLMVGRAGDTLFQMAFPYAGAAIHVRTSNQVGNEGQIWQPWKRLFDSVNKPGTADVTGLDTALAALAPKANPTFTGTVTVPTVAASTNSTAAASTAFVKAAIAAMVDAAPSALDTLNELAAAIGDDPNFATTMTTLIGTKLASADFTAANILARLLTVDGSGSGLDADLLDGLQASDFLRSNISSLVLANPGIGNPSALEFTKTSDRAGIRVTETVSDSTAYVFYMADNPDSSNDYFQWEMSDWAGSQGKWVPLKFSGLNAAIDSVQTTFRGGLSLEGQPRYSNDGLVGEYGRDNGAPALTSINVSNYIHSGRQSYILVARSASSVEVFRQTGNTYIPGLGTGTPERTPVATITADGTVQTFDGIQVAIPAGLTPLMNWRFAVWPKKPVAISADVTVTGSMKLNNVDVATVTYADAAIDTALSTNPTRQQPALPAGTALNSVTTIGTYYFDVAANVTTALNFPSANRTGRLIVDKNYAGDHIFQEYRDDSGNSMWIRYSTNGGAAWGGWSQVSTMGNLSTVSQPDAEAGTSTSTRLWTAQRVRQAVAAYAPAIVHTHAVADVTGLQVILDQLATDLANKQAAGSYEPARSAVTQAIAEGGTDTTILGWSALRVRQAVNAVVGALTKSSVGLGNVDNTSDANKPVSTATQTALDGKVGKSGDHTITGKIIVGGNNRNGGMIGTYDINKTQQIWSMGASYLSAADGANFGTLYGLAYKNVANTTGGTMGGGHQICFVANGTAKCSLGDGIWTSGNVTAYSDIRVKTNLELVEDALDRVTQLNGYTYDRTDTGEHQLGVVAQEVLKVFPELVTGDEEAYSVAYGNFAGVFIEAFKEVKAKIEAQERTIEALEQRLAKLEAAA